MHSRGDLPENLQSLDELKGRIATLSPAKCALLGLRLKKKGSDAPAQQTIPRRVTSDLAPPSFAQQRLWFLDQLEPNSPLYNITRAVRLKGVLDVEALQRALDGIVARHEILRTTFISVEGSPVQTIAEGRTVELAMIDLSTCPEAQRELELQHLLVAEVRRPFNLSQDLILRATVVRLGGKEHILLLVMHHIATDGWSMGIFFRELVALYTAFSTGKPSPLWELPIQYADFAVWQRQWLRGEEIEAQLAYWKRRLAGLPVLELPTGRPRPAVQTYRGAKQSLILPKSLTGALEAVSLQERVTLFMTLLAAFQILLHRYTGQDDIPVGSPIAGRNRAEIEGLIGFFINTLVLRTDLSRDPTFRELLARVREVCLGAYAHQDLPFEKLVEELRPERDLSRPPLFQIMFILQNTPLEALELPGLTVSPLNVSSDTAKFDLTLSIEQAAGSLATSLEYNTDLFDEATISRMLGHFQTLLQSIAANPEQRLSDLPILTDAEGQQLLVEWNDTKKDYPEDQCIHKLIEVQVERTPDAVAVVFEDQRLTY
ncbi:MAG: non-ribosomal peptide synthetase, partial [Deltaproteobacteria bacterium]|nr:non-ribosomal peptide synthetase [Deltaproteobacteria bacterium]